MLESRAGEIILARDFKLAPPLDYTVQAGNESRPKRRFAAGLAVDPVSNYYITPDMVDLVSDLAQGKYCVLCGPRQSGKSTMVLAARRKLTLQSEATLIYLDGLEGARMSWSSHDFWGYICDTLTLKCPTLFPKQQLPCYTPLVFKSLFVRSKLQTLVTVILDEADSLLNIPSDIVHEFFATIRSIKSDKDAYNLHGFLLVGVETVKDLLEAQYNNHAARTERTHMPSSTSSHLSPFPHDHVLASSRRSSGRSGAGSGEQSRITWELTYGQATYNRILGFIRKQEQDIKACKLLIRYLEIPGLYCGPETLVQLRDFIAHGVLAVTDWDSDDEESGAETYYAIKNLDGEVMCRPECSEYMHQFLFLCSMKAILKHAYPCIPATVLPEVKEEIVPDQRRSGMRCDSLIHDGTNFSKFAVEIVANGTMAQISEHMTRALLYHD
ncbi:hypothetical protein SELMODRAFT_402142 [Selaginella moellendorffii]|uniref:ORC1/DEAH AAA+ ATPase domain-containing protein n=1 Tax=Selaginella moellendorffii TaxID=88036 RepID=D8QPQ7_SELML|nr:hypothetical protein SELMODRAFT_402142 [Selaginella moellendorffii]